MKILYSSVMIEKPVFDPETYTQDSKENWSKAAPHYDRISLDFFTPITKAFVSFARLLPGQRILDVACGPGTATIAAARAAGPSGKVVGVDLSPGMLKIAASRAASAEAIPAIEYREMNAESLDFPDDCFDAVICQLGLMLFAKPEMALREMARVVKKGGRVSCLVQGVADKMAFTSLIMRCIVKHAPQIKVPGAPALYDFGPAGILDLALEKAGLEEVASKRLEGTFAFNSAQDYWQTMTQGAGRTGAMLKSLTAQTQNAIQRDTLEAAVRFKADGKINIPYEVAMARGIKPK